MTRPLRRLFVYGIVATILATLVIVALRLHGPCEGRPFPDAIMKPKELVYDRSMPLTFIGGVPRSGTTLIRVMLDAHPEIRCGEETRVVPRILQMRHQWIRSQKESMRLEEAGITSEVLDAAVSSFILEVIAKHGDPAPRLCNKDPFTMKGAVYLHTLFPNAKFLLMVRDGRAVTHSIISRKVTITGFDLNNYRQCLTKWSALMEAMHDQCRQLGPQRCMYVYYEQLVMHPKEWMQRVLKFLDVPWNDSVLHHESFINKPGGVSLSNVERSTDQVIKPVNLEALSKWVGQIPEDVVRDMAQVAPMLSVMGYDPMGNPPKYGDPDSFVADNTDEIQRNQKWWQDKARQVVKSSKKSNLVVSSTNPGVAFPSNANSDTVDLSVETLDKPKVS